MKIDKLWLVDEKKSDGYSALHLTCLNNYIEILHLLLKIVKNLDLNITNLNQQTPLHMAVERKHLNIVNLLVSEHKCKVNVQDTEGDAPLHSLLKTLNLVQFKNNVDGTASGERKFTEKMEQLDLNDEKNSSNLHWQIACLLIDHDADLFIKNKKNQTPLDICVDVNFKNNLTEYYLHHTSKNKLTLSALPNTDISLNIPTENIDTCEKKLQSTA